MKRIFVMILALMLLLSAAGCTTRHAGSSVEGSEPVETDDPAKETPDPEVTEPAVSEEPVETEPLYRNFFNGQGLDQPDYTRPFAVMINNINVAQPQCGVSNADIIYEATAEGGITRMIAIFSDIKNAGVIGSIRSIRTYYVDLAMAYGAVAVHAGYSESAHARMKTYGVNNMCGVTGVFSINPFYRDSNRMYAGYEHSLFAKGDKIYDCAEALGYSLTIDKDYDNGLNFINDGTPEKGDAANAVDIAYNSYKSTDFTYHSDTGLYTAVQYGNNYYDGNTGDDMAFTNLITIFASEKVVDSVGRLDITLTGEGEGYFACGGKYVPIIWSRESDTGSFSYTLEDGTPLNIGVGKTFIAIVPANGGVVEFS